MAPTASAAARTRRAYDHRLREHVIRCGGKSIVKHVQIPRSTVSSWRRRGLRPVVTTEPLGLYQQHVFDSRARWEKQARVLAAVVRLLLALLRASGFDLAGKRLPGGEAKAGILRAVASAQLFLPLALILRIVGLDRGHVADIAAGDAAVDRIKYLCQRTHSSRVMGKCSYSGTAMNTAAISLRSSNCR